jgi:hypothetical protein
VTQVLDRAPPFLKDLEEVALKVHPGLHKVREEARKNEAELRIAKQYPNPEVEGTVSRQKEHPGDLVGVGYTVGLSQTLEWPGRRAKKQEAARFGIESAQKLVTNEELSVIAKLRNSSTGRWQTSNSSRWPGRTSTPPSSFSTWVEKRAGLGESRHLELLKACGVLLPGTGTRKSQDDAHRDRQVLNQFLLEKFTCRITPFPTVHRHG